MREIIFRGKTIATGDWVYGNLLLGMGDDKTFCEIEQTDIDDYMKWAVKRETVGQYTGLKDKNGKQIFEGDVLNYKRHSEDGNWASPMIFDKDYEIEVSFNKGMFIPKGLNAPLYEYIKDNTYGATGTNWEVVGNIHSNPELL